jgi:hypothetical protein
VALKPERCASKHQVYGKDAALSTVLSHRWALRGTPLPPRWSLKIHPEGMTLCLGIES